MRKRRAQGQQAAASGAFYPRRAIRAVFGPAGLRREHGPALDAVFHLVPAPADLGVQGRIQQ